MKKNEKKEARFLVELATKLKENLCVWLVVAL